MTELKSRDARAQIYDWVRETSSRSLVHRNSRSSRASARETEIDRTTVRLRVTGVERLIRAGGEKERKMTRKARAHLQVPSALQQQWPAASRGKCACKRFLMLLSSRIDRTRAQRKPQGGCLSHLEATAAVIDVDARA